MVHVPYKGSSPAMTDVIAGHVQAVVDSLGTTRTVRGVGQAARAGGDLGEALSCGRRTSRPLPNPGVPGLRHQHLVTGCGHPQATPKPIVDRLASEVQKIMRLPQIQQQLTSRGIEPVGSGPAEFRAYNAFRTDQVGQGRQGLGSQARLTRVDPQPQPRPEVSKTVDPIKTVEVALYQVPLQKPVSDAKVLTGRQKPLAHVDLLAATIETAHGARGFGFSYSLRAGGAALLAPRQGSRW